MSAALKVTQVKSKASASLVPNNLHSKSTTSHPPRSSASLPIPSSSPPTLLPLCLPLSSLSCSGRYYGYISRNEVYLVDHKPNLFEVEKAERVIKCAYAEKDPVSSIQLANLALGPALIVASTSGIVSAFDETGETLLHSHKLQKSQVALSAKDAYLRGIAHDGKDSVFLGSGSGDLLLFTLTQAKLALTKKIPTSFSRAIWAVHYSPQHSLLIAGDDAGNLSVFTCPPGTDSPTKAWEVKGNGSPITSLTCGHGLIVTADVTGRIRVYSLEKKALAVEICAHARTINAIDIHPTLPLVVAVSEDTYVSVWTLPTAAQPVVRNLLMGTPAPALLTGVAFSGKNGENIVVTIYDSKSLFNIPTPQL